MNGKISKVIAEKGFGFITGADGNEYFVHHSALRGTVLEDLSPGQAVVFDAGKGDKGPRAENVRLA